MQSYDITFTGIHGTADIQGRYYSGPHHRLKNHSTGTYAHLAIFLLVRDSGDQGATYVGRWHRADNTFAANDADLKTGKPEFCNTNNIYADTFDISTTTWEHGLFAITYFINETPSELDQGVYSGIFSMTITASSVPWTDADLVE